MRVRIAKWGGRRREMMMTVMMTSWFSSSPTKHRDWRGSCLRVHDEDDDARRMYYFPCIHFCEKSVTWWWCWMKMMMTMIQIEKTDLNWRVDKFADVVWFDRRCNRRRDSNAIRMWFRCDSDVIQMLETVSWCFGKKLRRQRWWCRETNGLWWLNCVVSLMPSVQWCGQFHPANESSSDPAFLAA